ncbi:MAG: DUF2271 domain-containing protein [Acidimicrobiia bacterium]|nr:DUF2271 domain-containing protein [Acidimicrobiia bacterium]
MAFDARGQRGPRPETRLHDRRTFLYTLYGWTLGAVLAACAGDDADVFAAEEGVGSGVSAGSDGSVADQDGATPRTLRVQTDESKAAAATTGTGETTSTVDPATSSTDETTATTSTTASSETTRDQSATTSSSQAAGGGGAALPAGGTMVVAFTYEQQSGGKNVPPYIAVWIEDGSGELLATVALWYQQFGRGERWLPDLTRWYNVDQSRIASGGADTVDAISGPTRSPGSYQVAWGGQANGLTAPAGTYFVCIESARERGPYSLIRQSVNLGGSTQQLGLASDGELVNASISVTA